MDELLEGGFVAIFFFFFQAVLATEERRLRIYFLCVCGPQNIFYTLTR